MEERRFEQRLAFPKSPHTSGLSAKKTDVVKHSQVFRDVGLLN